MGNFKLHETICSAPRPFIRGQVDSGMRHQDADFQFSQKFEKSFGSTSCRLPRSVSVLPQFPLMTFISQLYDNYCKIFDWRIWKLGDLFKWINMNCNKGIQFRYAGSTKSYSNQFVWVMDLVFIFIYCSSFVPSTLDIVLHESLTIDAVV